MPTTIIIMGVVSVVLLGIIVVGLILPLLFGFMGTANANRHQLPSNRYSIDNHDYRKTIRLGGIINS